MKHLGYRNTCCLQYEAVPVILVRSVASSF